MAYQAHKESPELSWFEPDVLIPAEYYENTLRGKDHREPEVRLMAAVLQDAVQCFQRYLPSKTAKAQRLLAETEEWFFGEERDEEVFSFENICATLGLDRDYLRRGLIEWKNDVLSRNVKNSNHARKSSFPPSIRPVPITNPQNRPSRFNHAF